MNGWWIREIQELEYIECLRKDIEREIVEYEVKNEKMETVRFSIESKLTEDAEQLDYDLERCKLSPRSLRLKRLEFYEKKNSPPYDQVSNTDNLSSEQNTAKTVLTKQQCTSITKKGKRCLKISILGMNVCHIHNK